VNPHAHSFPPELPEIERAPRPAGLRTALLAALAAAVVALMLFSWLADEVFEGDVAAFDARVRNAVHAWASPALTAAMRAFSIIGYQGLIAALAVAIVTFLWLRWRRAALWLVFSVAGALVLDLALKNAFHRPRPAPFFGDLPHSYSFPSGHALFSFCFYGVLAGLLSARLRSPGLKVLVWVLAAALIAAIGLSRIYLGVHYPSDVLAGYLAAAVWVSSLVAADRWRRGRNKNQSGS
jgi:membrane-associated phospholipid phosphatase